MLLPGFVFLVATRIDSLTYLTGVISPSLYQNIVVQIVTTFFNFCICLGSLRVLAWAVVFSLFVFTGSSEILRDILKMANCVGTFAALNGYKRLLVCQKLIPKVFSSAMLFLLSVGQALVPLLVCGVIMGGDKLSRSTQVAATIVLLLFVPFCSFALSVAAKPAELSGALLKYLKREALYTVDQHTRKLQLKTLRSFQPVGFWIGSFHMITPRFKNYYWYDVSINSCNLMLFLESA